MNVMSGQERITITRTNENSILVDFLHLKFNETTYDHKLKKHLPWILLFVVCFGDQKISLESKPFEVVSKVPRKKQKTEKESQDDSTIKNEEHLHKRNRDVDDFLSDIS